MDFTALNIFIICCIELGAYFIKGISGFGEPLITNPLLSLIIPASMAVPTSLVTSIPLTAWVAWRTRKEYNWRLMLPFGFLLAAGMIPGALIFKQVSGFWWIKVILGAVVVVIGLNGIFHFVPPLKKAPSFGLVAFVCLISGISAGIFGISLYFVPLVQHYLKSRGAYKGGICLIFIVENIARFIMYNALGIYNKDIWMIILIAVPCIAAGMFVGTRVEKKLSDSAVFKTTYALFTAGGLSTLIKALIYKV